MQSRAAVFYEAGRPLELVTLDVPALSPGEVLVEIACATICGSDLHTIHGQRALKGPTILGHEMIGRVLELSGGETEVCDLKGDRIQIGDRVTWSIAVDCGECPYCRRGLPQKCVSLFKYGHEPIAVAPLSGGLAEHCLLRKNTRILKVPDTLEDQIACPANCATATVEAAFRSAGDPAGKTIVIHGAGLLGLTAAAVARYFGAENIIVTDLAGHRLERAKQFGATHTINPQTGPEQLARAVRERTAGFGADAVLEMSGSPQAAESSLDFLGIGGKLILVGAVFPTRHVQFPPERIVRNLWRIEGVHNYTPRDLVAAISFLEATRDLFPWAELVTERFPLTEVNQAIESASQSRSVRVAVENGSPHHSRRFG